MLATVFAAANTGFNSELVEIECDITNGLPSLIIVGLPNKAIDEAKERVRSAIKNSGLKMPQKRITLNLAPADLPKHGTAYDLAMAVSILAASKQIPYEQTKDSLFVGELALDGKLRPVSGALSYAELARKQSFIRIFVPPENSREAALIDNLETIPTQSLQSLYRHLLGEQTIQPQAKIRPKLKENKSENDLANVYGQEQAKRALEVAAAGNHNILLTGPPGTGKTMLAKAILSILPPPSFEEILEITKIHSLAGNNGALMTRRPFRSPHHTASSVALIGGGNNPRPGEISLSHHGVLFLDELPEFPRNVLESLRQPLEDKSVTVSRASRSITYPSRFMLVATKNPCPCGYAGDPLRECSCPPGQLQRYSKRISGPLLDRIDITATVGRIEQSKLLMATPGESSSVIGERVERARLRQAERFGSTYRTNADMSNQEIKRACVLSKPALAMAEQALAALDISGRAYMRILKVARTIADLDEATAIDTAHLGEALQYRHQPLDLN